MSYRIRFAVGNHIILPDNLIPTSQIKAISLSILLFFYRFKQHNQFRLSYVAFFKQEAQTTKFASIIH